MADKDDDGPLIPGVEYIARRCLKCNKRFMAPGRFIRTCHNCRSYSSRYAAPSRQYKVHNGGGKVNRDGS